MNIIDAVKAVYSSVKEKTLLYDEQFRPLWKNTEDVDTIMFDDLSFDSTVIPRLPIEQETVCRVRDSLAVRIVPLYEEEKLCAYLLTVYDLKDVQRIFAHSAKFKEQSVFVGNIRTCLSDLSLTAEKLRRKPLYYASDAAKEIRQALLKTLAATANQSIVNRISSGRVRLTGFDLSSELAASVSETAGLIDPGICTLTADIAPDISLKGSWLHLECAVLNLIVNAYMYSSAMKKEITVKLERADGNAVISVSDNGTDADIERIERLSHYVTREIEFKERECLGLVLARSTAELMGGTLSLKNSPTGGLTAEIILPCPETNLFALRSPDRHMPFIPFETQYCILAKGNIPKE